MSIWVPYTFGAAVSVLSGVLCSAVTGVWGSGLIVVVPLLIYNHAWYLAVRGQRD